MYDKSEFTESEELSGGVGKEQQKRCSKFMFGPNFYKRY